MIFDNCIKQLPVELQPDELRHIKAGFFVSFTIELLALLCGTDQLYRLISSTIHNHNRYCISLALPEMMTGSALPAVAFLFMTLNLQ